MLMVFHSLPCIFNFTWSLWIYKGLWLARQKYPGCITNLPPNLQNMICSFIFTFNSFFFFLFPFFFFFLVFHFFSYTVFLYNDYIIDINSELYKLIICKKNRNVLRLIFFSWAFAIMFKWFWYYFKIFLFGGLKPLVTNVWLLSQYLWILAKYGLAIPEIKKTPSYLGIP